MSPVLLVRRPKLINNKHKTLKETISLLALIIIRMK